MARQTFRDVVDEVRAMMVDQEGLIFKDSVLLRLVTLANRRVHTALAYSGVGNGLFLTDSTTDIPITAVTQLTLDWTSATPLPDNLLVPLKLWEKPTGSTDDNYVEMVKVYRPSDLVQNDRLLIWWWENNQIRFIGTTASQTIRMEYIRLPEPVTDLSANLPIAGSADALTYYTAQLCALSRGSLEQAAAVKAEADAAFAMLSNLNQKSEQEGQTRRNPYSAAPTNSGGRLV